jgi:hypothetical protein
MSGANRCHVGAPATGNLTCPPEIGQEVEWYTHALVHGTEGRQMENRNHHSTEQFIHKLREAEGELAKGRTVVEVSIRLA